MTGRKDPSKYKFTEERKKEPVKIGVYWWQEGKPPKNVRLLITGKKNMSKYKFTDYRKEEHVKI